MVRFHPGNGNHQVGGQRGARQIDSAVEARDPRHVIAVEVGEARVKVPDAGAVSRLPGQEQGVPAVARPLADRDLGCSQALE